ncbi:MAG TPA: C39 family peptidase, partial [Myxococcales bacterium]|nr:C39 family peptidase [Myxococcales bacterium]
QPADPRIDTRMEDLGYLPPGGATDARAVSNFQAMNKLPVTGELDQRTVDAMWSPAARQSFQVVQFQNDTYNATKTAGSDNAGGDNNCGPASVGMALASVGLADLDNADPQALVNQMRADTGVPVPGKTGTTALELAAQKNGAETYRVDDLDEVKLAVMRGDPVTLYGVPNRDGAVYNAPASEGSIDPGAGHWVAVVGYDPKSDTFVVNDPLCRDGTRQLTQEQLSTYADFGTAGVAVHAPPPPPALTHHWR